MSVTSFKLYQHGPDSALHNLLIYILFLVKQLGVILRFNFDLFCV